ncbi:DnaA N-terminal domain-containing protein [Rhodobacter sp. TJ_12]|uniref:DnaA N-terminal domain-containing protein n=1 Tax=Rhodobacter sp. TJ_12 TaxID=2029399 RepID=UPI001CC10B43|nr:DnaA N-terminal domain-containing protein [Rhodobacter sp. TJ_12]
MKKAVGRGGATRKYDLLTILGVHALSQGKTLQRQTLRLICLITARYNWQNDHLSVGQTEIARLWSVDTRTVKREMAVFRERGWLIEKRPAARGRVTVYGLGISQILEDTRASWEMVGPDLVKRLDGPVAEVEDSKVIPFPQVALPAGEGVWPRIARRLQEEDASIYRAWFAALEVEEMAEELWLRAPSAFHATYVRTHHMSRLEAALALEAPGYGVRLS